MSYASISPALQRRKLAMDQELDYYRVIKSKGGIELVEGQLHDKGSWGTYGPGGWHVYKSRAEAEKEYNWLVQEYGS